MIKRFISGLILAVIVTPALAENLVNQQLKTSSYRMEVKEGEEILSTLNFAAIDSERTKVQSWNVQSHTFNDSDPTATYKVKTGFSITLSPVINNENVFGISFDYRQPVNQNKPKQPIYTFEYTFEKRVVLPKGGSFCTDLDGTGEKVEFCLFRN